MPLGILNISSNMSACSMIMSLNDILHLGNQNKKSANQFTVSLLWIYNRIIFSCEDMRFSVVSLSSIFMNNIDLQTPSKLCIMQDESQESRKLRNSHCANKIHIVGNHF